MICQALVTGLGYEDMICQKEEASERVWLVLSIALLADTCDMSRRIGDEAFQYIPPTASLQPHRQGIYLITIQGLKALHGIE